MTELLRSPLLRSEWTKFRTVRGWVIGIVLAPVLTVLLGALTASGSQCGIGPGPGLPVELACTSPIGPGGQAVQDQFYFVHQSLTGNGSLTVRLTSLTGTGLQPCSKAGIMIKASVKPGSAYAAMLATAGLYIQDTAALRDLPLPPLTGLGVPTAWTATALLLAATVLRRRDAYPNPPMIAKTFAPVLGVQLFVIMGTGGNRPMARAGGRAGAGASRPAR